MNGLGVSPLLPALPVATSRRFGTETPSGRTGSTASLCAKAVFGYRGKSMSEALGHKFGQTLGEYCEKAIEALLQEFADEYGLYLDKQGARSARPGKKVKWLDGYGNSHDLDYVLERGGSVQKIGTPVAFIESAWRRYTKHSRNKAQEIQGAIMPLCDRHRFCAPFKGCFLVGEYTSGAREQLASMQFRLLHFDYPTIVAAFATVGIDARFDEGTTDAEFRAKQKKWGKLSVAEKTKVWKKLLELNAAGVKAFMQALRLAVVRRITEVRVIPLHGKAYNCTTVQEAIEFVAGYGEETACAPLVKYEVQIRYSNEDRVEAQFGEKDAAIEFLEHYLNGNWTPLDDEEQPLT
jgi:hypothetical protein